jgi:MoxR-like ATPase
MKNIDSINRSFLLPNFKLEKKEKWYEFSIIDLIEEEEIHSFEWKKPISSLYDTFYNKTNTKFNSIIDFKNMNNENEIDEEVENNIVPFQKKTDSFVSEINNITPDEKSLDKNPSKIFRGFYFPDFLPNFLNRVRSKRNIFLSGESGTGKSEMVQKLADFYEQTLIRINFHQGVTESSLIGKYVVKNSETIFAYGLVPLAMKKGYWLLLDEIDYAEPEHTSVLQAVLEGKELVITSNEGEIISPHPSFRVFATGNTTGRGDSTDSYHGTNFMNSAFLDRWTIFEMTYSKKEFKILNSIINDLELSKKIVRIFELFRSLKKNGDISNAVFSTRRMMNIAEALKMGDSISEAFKYEVFTRFNSEEIMILTECIRDILDSSHYLENEWKLGQPHHSPMSNIQEK